MKELIIIPLEPLSINRTKCRDQRYTTTYYKDYIYNVLNCINKPTSITKINNIKKFFNKKKHAIHLELTFYYPRNIFYTEKDEISSKVHDLSNIEKPLIDIIFLSTHSTDALHNLNIDDKYIIDLISKKRAADEYSIEVLIEVVNIENSESIIIE